jgi:hypothetical protein
MLDPSKSDQSTYSTIESKNDLEGSESSESSKGSYLIGLLSLSALFIFIIFGYSLPASAKTKAIEKIASTGASYENLLPTFKNTNSGKLLRKLIKEVPNQDFQNFMNNLICNEILLDKNKIGKAINSGVTQFPYKNIEETILKKIPLYEKTFVKKFVIAPNKNVDKTLRMVPNLFIFSSLMFPGFPGFDLPSIGINFVKYAWKNRGGFNGNKNKDDNDRHGNGKNGKNRRYRNRDEYQEGPSDPSVRPPYMPFPLPPWPSAVILVIAILFRMLGKPVPKKFDKIMERILPKERKISMAEYAKRKLVQSLEFLLTHPQYIIIVALIYYFRAPIYELFTKHSSRESFAKDCLNIIEKMTDKTMEMFKGAIQTSTNLTNTLLNRDNANHNKTKSDLEKALDTVDTKNRVIMEQAVNSAKNEGIYDTCINKVDFVTAKGIEATDYANACSNQLSAIAKSNPSLPPLIKDPILKISPPGSDAIKAGYLKLKPFEVLNVTEVETNIIKGKVERAYLNTKK